MTLTSQLSDKNSQVSQFMRSRFPNTLAFLKIPRKQVRESPIQLRPDIPEGASPYPYSAIGMAIDYRIRYYFEVTPNEELIAYRGFRRFDSRRITNFFEKLEGLISSLKPVGNRLSAHQEDDLNRYCFLLALLEDTVRPAPQHESPLYASSYGSTEELLDIAEPHVLSDMRELSWAFYDNYSHLLSRPHTLNPTFEGSRDVGGADADLIVDGTLMEMKTSSKSEIKTEALLQLLGYVLLDYSDKYGLDAIALYMARQGLYLRWDLEEALRGLCGEHPPTLEDLRAEFKEMLQRTENYEWIELPDLFIQNDGWHSDETYGLIQVRRRLGIVEGRIPRGEG